MFYYICDELIIRIMKGLNKPRFLIQILLIPALWAIAVFKVLIIIPTLIVAKCNDIMEGIE
jgi:hypothetical protein